MKKSPEPKRPTPAKRAGKKAKPAKGYWHFDHLVQGATEEKMGRIWDAFIDAVEKEGLICAGTYHPGGQCNDCKDED